LAAAGVIGVFLAAIKRCPTDQPVVVGFSPKTLTDIVFW
jgi:hypothetical protein